MKRLFVLFLICCSLVLGTICFSGNRSSDKEIVSSSIMIQMDQPVFLSFEEMTENSDLVVLGSYTGEYTEYKNDLHLDEMHMGIARQYGFIVESVLSGDPIYSEESIITVVKPVSYPFDYKTKGGESYVIQVPASLHIEPQTDIRYILFVEYVPETGFYRSIGEPWEISVTDDGILGSASEVFISEESSEPDIVRLETDDRIYEIKIKSHDGMFEDFISGRTLEEAIDEIKGP